MGRATIVSGGTDGRYTISVDTGAAQKTARITALTTTIAALTTKISDIQAPLALAEAAVVVAQNALRDAITQYVLATQASPDQSTYADELRVYIAASKTLFNKQATAQPLRARLALLQSQKKAAEKDMAAVLDVAVEISRDAWCADCTEDGAGLVGTIEIPGESNLILIQPDCPAPIAGDGQLLDRRFMSPEQAFWNVSVLPGWQKWKPMYRRGVITAIDFDTDLAAVTLDAAVSSAQSLAVNRVTSLASVPVVYMTCNARAFEVGDNCVVEFTGYSWDVPTVIGFVDNPRRCGFTVTYTYEVYPAGAAGTFPPSLAEQDVTLPDDWVVVTAQTPGSGWLFRRWSEGDWQQVLLARDESISFPPDFTATALYYNLAEYLYRIGEYNYETPGASPPPFGIAVGVTYDESTGLLDEFGFYIEGTGDKLLTCTMGEGAEGQYPENEVVWTATFRRVFSWDGPGNPYVWADAVYESAPPLVWTVTSVSEGHGSKTVTATFSYNGSSRVPVWYEGFTGAWVLLGGNEGYRAPVGLNSGDCNDYILRANFTFVSQTAQTQFDTP